MKGKLFSIKAGSPEALKKINRIRQLYQETGQEIDSGTDEWLTGKGKKHFWS
ncbi:MAG: hypothetical protein V1847_01220 [Candidatus Diapherotrites archaeon]